ncbi:MAG: RluA family pseudouridine synthase [Ruminococcaceae bacterium]|nr:RluA family pseudouridine synthase [Oscillospiraceae bacterium]
MKYIITKDKSGKSIKEFLRENGLSAGLLKKLKKIENGITVNSVHQNVTYRLQENDILNLLITDFEEDTNEYLEPVDLPIEIIFENENITVVNKPGNMPTHQSLNNHNNTLANALRYRYRDKPYVFRASNRLDKDTSGIVITANNRYYAAMISEKIKRGEVMKEYIAVVSGKLDGDGVIDAPIDRVGKSIIKRMVREDGEGALTEYKSLFSCDDISVVSVTPKTGRTHQIRVHMAHIGHPIVGDSLYFESNEYINRQALHCLRMDLGDLGSYYAPVPEDMLSLIRRYFKDEEIVF